jgi:hypothetical protein
MAQITLYLDAETARKLKAAAEAAGKSESQWVGALIALAGAWADHDALDVPP